MERRRRQSGPHARHPRVGLADRDVSARRRWRPVPAEEAERRIQEWLASQAG